jgi:hypothetical protein
MSSPLRRERERPADCGRMRARCALAAAVGLLAATAVATGARAATVPLGTADSFAVLGGSAVTNTGPSVIGGDLGVNPGTAVSGFPPGIVLGAPHFTDAVALHAQQDLTTAYNDAAGRSSSATISSDLAGRTLTRGVYTAATSLGLSGALTLDGQGNADAVFVFQAGTTLTAGSGSHVLLTGGAQACNVFWQVGSSATVGSGSAFVGNIMALTSITLTTGATLDGRALARNGAVTLDTNVVSRARCATPTSPTSGTPTSPGTTTPVAGQPGGESGTATSPTSKAAVLAEQRKTAALQRRVKAKKLKQARAASRLRQRKALELKKRRRATDLTPRSGRPGRPPRTPGRFTG